MSKTIYKVMKVINPTQSYIFNSYAEFFKSIAYHLVLAISKLFLQFPCTILELIKACILNLSFKLYEYPILSVLSFLIISIKLAVASL